MVRPLRIEFPGAIYHVTSRGDRRETIFEDDQDRHAFLTVVGQAMDRFDAVVLAYCLMDNHYHAQLTHLGIYPAKKHFHPGANEVENAVKARVKSVT